MNENLKSRRAWGIAAFQAWDAYQDDGSLKFAVSAWEALNVDRVQPLDAAQGKHATRAVSIEATCNGGVSKLHCSLGPRCGVAHVCDSIDSRRGVLGIVISEAMGDGMLTQHFIDLWVPSNADRREYRDRWVSIAPYQRR